MIIVWINKCTSDWLFFPFFSSLLKKKGEENVNELTNPFFVFIYLIDNHYFKITNNYCTYFLCELGYES